MKENTLFKLDLLQSYYLQKPARFGITKQLLRSDKYHSKAEGKERHEKNKHKLLQLSRDEARKMIKELQAAAFEKKLYFIEVNLTRNIIKVLKKERQKNLKISEKLEPIDTLLQKDSQILENNLKNKIYKTLLKSFPTKLDVKNNTFEGVPSSSIEYIRTMKETNTYKTNSAELNNLFSKLFAEKSIKQALEQIETMEIVWGPKTYKKNASKDANSDDDELAEFDEEGESLEEISDINDAVDQAENSELEEQDYEQLYEGYKNYIAASSDEEEEDVLALDPSVNYNEITDDEPSDNDDDDSDPTDSQKKSDKKRSLEQDDFFAQPEEKKKMTMKNIQLPVLATGYYSGGESEEEKDNLVDEITNPRKNRRGQRARQKIWEKKYGKTAKHVIQQQERSKSERERLRLEYEERQRKRDAKQRLKNEKQIERDERNDKQKEKATFVHPSWEAKLKQQEALKSAKFSGKKITFD